MKRPSWFYQQSGVVPFRQHKDGCELLLVTTRKKGLWTIPKGVVEPGLTATESATREAWEEAGIKGVPLAGPLGSYRQQKWGGVCRVEVFLFQVRQEAPTWPESGVRERCWFPLKKALKAVHNQELRALLKRVPKRLEESGRHGAGSSGEVKR